MKSKILFIFVVFVVLAGVWLGLRFTIGGSEDAWICVDGAWVRHGNPQAPTPTKLCSGTKTIKLYYYNSESDRDKLGNVACGKNGLVAVERKIPITQTPIQDAIRLLLLGELTGQERALGIGTEYPLEGFSLKGASLKDGVLTLEFNDISNKTSGGSCRAGILWFQIESTAKQFPEVQQVRFLPEDIFQP
ncbi:MAG: GerMN domain-containing protein [Patescibacteria group bacterium]|nr:GerMN domain-containing protein [Patescibacteria group bacterium]